MELVRRWYGGGVEKKKRSKRRLVTYKRFNFTEFEMS